MASLFDQPKNSGDGGDFWPGVAGSFIVEVTGFDAGPTFSNTQPDGSVKESPQVRWNFDVYKLDGSRVQYTPDSGPKQGQSLPASKDALSSTVISKKSKAGGGFEALLGEEIDFDKVTAEELMERAIGKRGFGVFKKNDGGRVVLSAIAPYEQ